MKKLSRMISLLLCALLAVSAFTACGRQDGGETPEPEKADNFEQEAFAVANALSIGLRFFEDETVLENSSVMWNTLGWYCSYKSLNGGEDYLTRTQVNALQRVLRPGASIISPPENWVKYGSLVVEEKDGQTLYYFPGFADDFKSITETLKPELSVVDSTYVKVVLTNEEGEPEEYVFGFEKIEDSTSDFPYALSYVELPEVQTAIEPAADFTLLDVREANKLSNLLSIYGTVKCRRFFADEEYAASDYFYKNGEICELSRDFDAEDLGFFGCYGDRDFYLRYYEDGSEGTHLCSNQIISLNPDEVGEIDPDLFVSQYIEYGTLGNIQDNGETYTFELYVESGFNEYDDAPIYYEIDKGTLALKKITMYKGESFESRIEFNYGKEFEDYGLFDGWDSPLRTVRVTAIYHDEKGEEISFTQSFEVPKNMELYPIAPYSLTELYFNRELTEPYVYSDSLGDYTVYITDAMG